MALKTKGDNRIQDDYDEQFNDITNHLRSQESQSNNPNAAPIEDGGSSAQRVKNTLKNKEEQGSTSENNPTWKDMTVPKQIKTAQPLARILLKRGTPLGGVLGIVMLLGGLLGGFLAPGSLFLNLKENLTLNWDQQNYTAEIRSRYILSKRLTEQSTSGACGKIEIICRYTKPSTKVLKDLDSAGIKALDKSGNVIERGKLLGGTRPEHWQLPDGTKIAAKDFRSTLSKKENAAIRNAFRRAYNPRWVNWFDDVAMKFLQKMNLVKTMNTAISEAIDSKAAREGLEETMQRAANGIDNAGGGTKVFNELAEKEGEKLAVNLVEQAGHKSNAAVMTAMVGCGVVKAPGIISTVIRNFRLVQMAAVAFQFMVVADKIKAGDGTPKEADNLGTMLTERGLTTVADSTTALATATTALSAMDSGAIKYGLFGDRGSALSSKTVKYWSPGYTGNPTFDQAASLGQNENVKKVCDIVNSDEADVAITALAATNPPGWIMLGISVGLLISNKAGWTQAFIDSITPAISGMVKGIISFIDWKPIIEALTAFITNAHDLQLGDMIGTTLSAMFAMIHNRAGALPLTPEQALAYNDEIVAPTKLAWAQEDRLTHSPFDATNPNTFLGSITTQMMRYYSSNSTVFSNMAAATKLVASIPSIMLGKKATALSVSDWQQCPLEMDYAISSSGVAAGPLCDIQYGVPAKYMGTDPETIAEYLYNNGQIDEQGEIKPRSEFESWIDYCNDGNTYSLSACTVPDDDSDESIKRAYFALYQIDKRTVDGMDNEPQSNVSSSDIAAAPGDNTAPCDTNTIDMGIYDNAHDNGVKTSIRLCAVPNLPAPGYQSTSYYSNIKAVDPAKQQDANGKALVNARASGDVYRMVEAAKSEKGIAFSLGQYFAFRSYEHQVALREEWCNKGQCENAAKPGYSNHEMGLAIDFSLPGGPKSFARNTSAELQWLRTTAGKYGFAETVATEDWHWAYTR